MSGYVMSALEFESRTVVKASSGNSQWPKKKARKNVLCSLLYFFDNRTKGK